MTRVSPILQRFWEQTLKTMPKKEVQASLKEIGFPYPTGNLSKEQVRKLLYGFLAQLDESLQADAIQTISEKR
ncbi:hypothetical protein [Effusibacillus pohliae]|uniref:hypothetical protein n=1 Tax=Effusibacillus pohliae TaxID=232270 RepID=UPI00036DED5A|nr:hypothetical protein [Effusibacillus pohliae]